MINSFKTFYEPTPCNAINIERGKLYPLVKWLSGAQKSIRQVSKINNTAFWIPHQLVFADLYYSINKGMRFFKYPKKVKGEKENEVLINCLKKKLCCGKSEINKNWHLIEAQLTKDELQQMTVDFGLNGKECKALGVKFEKPNFKIKVEKKQKGLMDY